ncbi:MAG: hypothetical protein OXJ52_05070, partial [Oligoflexia bacterium]|nr:hypothetical protein [Oligoflexia bacterium]
SQNNPESITPADSNTASGSPMALPPIWTQTNYVFQNKTDSQISILTALSGGKYAPKVVLNTGECIYINYLPFSLVYAKFIKAGKGLICGPCLYNKDCEQAICSDKLNPIYQNFKRDTNSPFPYLEVYNITDSDQMLTAGIPLPLPADPALKAHWKKKCQPSLPSSPPVKK